MTPSEAINSLHLDVVQRKAKCDHQIRVIEQSDAVKVQHEGQDLKLTPNDLEGEWVSTIIAWVKGQHG